MSAMTDIPAPLAQAIEAAFPGILASNTDGDGPLVPVEQHVAFAQLLKDQGYTLYVSVIATHFPLEQPKGKRGEEPPPEVPEHFQVATVLRDPSAKASRTFWWRVQLEPGQAVETLVPLFAGADWQEREQFDLVGVRFAEHPDLRRLMMPEDWPGHPLQKSYAIDTPHAPWR